MGISPLNPTNKLLVIVAVIVAAGLVIAGAFVLFPGKGSDNADQNPGVGSVKVTSALSKTNISLGESIIDSATVPGVGNGTAAPTGTVTFQVKIGSGQWTAFDTETLTANGADGIANSSAYKPLSVDTYIFRVTYSGDSVYPNSTSTEVTLNILTGLYATSVTPSLSQSTISLGQSVTQNVTVEGLGATFPVPLGSVTFEVKIGTGSWTAYDTKNLTASGSNGVATSIQYTASASGSHYFRALYLGDDNYMAAQSGDDAAPLTVNLGLGSLTNVLSSSTIGLGESVNDTVTVPGPGASFPAPSGSVTFQVKFGSGAWTTYDTKTLSTSGINGTANSTTYTPMAVGTYYFRVIYAGDANNQPSQTADNAATLTVNPGQGASPVSMVLSQTTITIGSSVTGSVTVPGIGASFPAPTGSVEFQVRGSGGNWTTYDTKTLTANGNDAVATSVAYSPVFVDSYYFRAVYLGNSNYAVSHSADNGSLLTVNPGEGLTTITSVLSQSTITFGDSVTASVTVQSLSGSPIPTGLIRFQEKVGAGEWTTYDTETLSASGTMAVASSTHAPTMAGSHYLRAVYLGDAYYASSQTDDNAEPLMVNPAQGGAPTTVLSKTTVNLGESVTDSVTIPSIGVNLPAPTGSVEFQVKIGSGAWTTYDTKTLTASGSNGTATSASYMPLNLGLYSFRAKYLGDSNYLVSQSADDADQLTVNPGQGAGPMTNSVPETIGLGSPVTNTVTVPGLSQSSPVPTGTITFQVKVGSGTWTTYDTKTLTAIGYNGSAIAASYLPLNLGSYSFRSNYSGDANYLPAQTADDAAVLTVVPGSGGQIIVVVSPSTINLGDSVTCTATVFGIGSSFPVPTGTVQFQIKNLDGPWTTFSTKTLITSGNDGVATSVTYKPTGGSYYFRVLYAGDANYAAGQSNDTATHLTINLVEVNTPVLTLPRDTVLYGYNVSLTVNIPKVPTYPVPTGMVEFQYKSSTGAWTTYDTKKLAATGTSATAWADPFSPMLVDTYTFRALYLGDWNYTSGQSAESSALTVIKAKTYTETALGVTNIRLGQSVRDNVTVWGINGSAIVPTGTVSFYVKNGSGAWTLYDENVALVDRTAMSRWYTPMEAAADFKFQAIYSGDSNFNGSASCPWSEPLNVMVARSQTSITIGPVEGNLGQSWTLNATVAGLGGSYPALTGTVTFQWQLNWTGPWTDITTGATLVNGVAVSSWFTPTVQGVYILRVLYSGDENYDNSSAAVALNFHTPV